MNLKFYPTVAAAMMLIGTATSKADTAIELYPSDTDYDVLKVNLVDIRKITFGTEELSIYQHDSTQIMMSYADIGKITFDELNSVESIIDNHEIVSVVPNPVVNDFTLTGAEKHYGETLTIYSITGQVVHQHSNWNGEKINVSNLPQGIYLLNINELTIKFIKL